MTTTILEKIDPFLFLFSRKYWEEWGRFKANKFNCMWLTVGDFDNENVVHRFFKRLPMIYAKPHSHPLKFSSTLQDEWSAY